MATIPTPPIGSGGGGATGGGAPAGSNIVLTITVDAKTGQLAIQNISSNLKSLGQTAQSAGQTSNQAGSTATSGWLKLYAQTQLIGQAFTRLKDMFQDTFVESTMLAARIEVLNTVMGLTAKTMNISAGAAQASVEGLRKMNITHQESIDITLQFIRAQLNLADTMKLARAAQDLAVVAGVNSSEATNTLTEAILTNREMLLRQFGIVKTLPMIFETYAASINRSADSLTTLERNQAILNTILKESAKVGGAYTNAMEEAGKRLTSLPRLFADLQEVIGNDFKPIMLAIIEVLEVFLRDMAKIPSWVYLAVGSFVAVGSAALTFKVAVLALGSALTELGFEATTVTAQLGLLKAATLTNPYFLFAAALTALVAGLISWRSALTETSNALVLDTQKKQGAVLQAQNLVNEINNQIDAEKRLQDVQKGAPLTTAEKGVYYSVTPEQQKALALERMTNAAASQRLLIMREARDLQISMNGLVDKEGNLTASLAELKKRVEVAEKARQTAAAAQLPALKSQIDQTQKLLDQEQQRHDYLLKMASSSGSTREIATLTSGFGANSRDLFKSWADSATSSATKVDELRASLKKLQDQLESLQHAATGVQMAPIDIGTSMNYIQNYVGALQTEEDLKRSGVKLSQQDLLLTNQIGQAMTTFYRDQARNAQNAIDTAKQYKLSQLDINAATDDRNHALQRAEELTKLINSDQGNSVQNAKNMEAQASKFAVDVNKAVDSQKIWNNNITGTQDALKGVQQLLLAAHQHVVSLQVLELNNQIAQLQAQNNVLGSIGKTDAEVEKMYDNQKKIASIQATIAIAGDRWQASQALSNAKAAAYVAEISKGSELLQRLTDLQNLQKDAVQAQMEITGGLLSIQQQMIKNDALDQIAQTTKEFTGKQLQAAETAILEKMNAQLATLKQQTQERQRQADLALLQQRQQTISATTGPLGTGYTPQQVQQMKDLDQQINVQQLKNYQQSTEFKQQLAQDFESGRTTAVKSLYALADQLAAQHYEYVKNLDEQLRESQYQKSRARTEVTLQVAGYSASDVNRELQMLDLQHQVEDTVRKLNLDYSTQQRLLAALTKELQRQFDMQREQERVAAAKTITEAGIGGKAGQAAWNQEQQAAENALKLVQQEKILANEAATAEQQTIALWQQGLATEKEVQDAHARTVAALQKLSDAQTRLNNTTLSLTQVIEAWMNGMAVSKITAITAAFTAMEDAALQAFEAIGAGQSAAKAFENFGAAILKQLAAFAMKKAEFWTAAAIADAFVDPPQAVADAAAAAAWFAAAAGLGIAAGATSAAASGGGGGGGGPASNIGTPKPVATITSSEQQIIQLNGNLTVMNRTLQYAGAQYSSLGAEMYTLTSTIQNMAATNSNAANQMANTLATQLGKVAQGGFQAGPLDSILELLNIWSQGNKATSLTQIGALEDLSTTFVEQTQQQVQQTISLPNTLAANLTKNLTAVNKESNTTWQSMLVVAKQQLVELQKANDKAGTINVDASTYLDSGALGTLTTQGFLTNVKQQSTAVSNSATKAMSQNVNRQTLGRLLTNGGI